MATTTSPSPDDRTNKRLKPAEGGPTAPGPMPPQPQGYGPPPPHYRGPPPPHMPPAAAPGGGYYGGPPPPQQPAYGAPPHHWQGGPPPPQGPPGYPRAPRGMSPERPGPPPSGWNGGYSRGSSPPKGRKPKIKPDGPDDPYYQGHPPPTYGHPPPPGYGPPPQHWQGAHMYPHGQGPWPNKSPPRGRHHDPYRHEMDMPPHYRGQASVDDDGGGSSVSGSNKEKGRGSYKCGRCGVPKKGHVCPYQPKLKRRPDEPPPQTRSAAVQVEMDEFMTLRRLNIRIQGLPESYATEPYMAEQNMVVGEPSQIPPPPPRPPDMPPHMHEMGTSMAPEGPETRDTGIGDGMLEEAEVPV